MLRSQAVLFGDSSKWVLPGVEKSARVKAVFLWSSFHIAYISYAVVSTDMIGRVPIGEMYICRKPVFTPQALKSVKGRAKLSPGEYYCERALRGEGGEPETKVH